MKTQKVFYWLARMLASLILLQTLFFKFSASAESVYIFTVVGIEPWGRIGIGILEGIAASMLIISATAWLGGAMALGLMLGAIGMHLTLLGVVVMQDGGYLFFLAILVAVCALFVVSYDRSKFFSAYNAVRRRFN